MDTETREINPTRSCHKQQRDGRRLELGRGILCLSLPPHKAVQQLLLHFYLLQHLVRRPTENRPS